MKNRNDIITTILLALGLLALSPIAYALNPPPDGGYPGGNTAEGQGALSGPTISGFNTAIGFHSLASLTDAGFNTGVGAGTLFASIGAENTATGAGALLSNTTGSLNTANGAFALVSNTSGNSNIALGSGAGSGVTTASNVIAIGTAGNNVNDSCYIGNIFGATSSSGIGVLVNSNGRLGTMTSSRRFKEEIQPMERTSEALFSLKPVTFHYKKEIDPAGTSQFGLVAEDVEKLNPNLVVRDEAGKPYSVRYDQVNAMLLNEFLKEHQIVQEQNCVAHEQAATIAELKSSAAKQEATIAQVKSTVAEQQKGIAILTAQLKEQAAQIQQVSADVELNRRVPQIVLSNR
jgi:uncharacterized coiled-coil protein SlyX